jgi:hypothetical protein
VLPSLRPADQCRQRLVELTAHQRDAEARHAKADQGRHQQAEAAVLARRQVLLRELLRANQHHQQRAASGISPARS